MVKLETIHSWSYQDALEAALPQNEQRHLNADDKDMDRKANFKVLENVYMVLEHTAAKWMVRNNDTAKPVRNSDLPWTAVGFRQLDTSTKEDIFNRSNSRKIRLSLQIGRPAEEDLFSPDSRHN